MSVYLNAMNDSTLTIGKILKAKRLMEGGDDTFVQLTERRTKNVCYFKPDMIDTIESETRGTYIYVRHFDSRDFIKFSGPGHCHHRVEIVQSPVEVRHRIAEVKARAK